MSPNGITRYNMTSSSVVLIFTVYLLYSTFCDGRSVPRDQDSSLGAGVPLLLFNFRFKEASALASRLISTMMDFRVELGLLVYNIVNEETTAERETRKVACFRSTFEKPWFRKIKPSITAHLERVLTNLMRKDKDLTEMATKCEPMDKGCNDRLKIQAVEEIDAFGRQELYSETRIKNMYISNITFEMERCLGEREIGVNSGS